MSQQITPTLGDLERVGKLRLYRGKVISKKDINATPGPYPIYSSSVQNNGLFGRYGQYMFDEELITWSVDGGGHFFYRPRHKFSVTNVCGYLRILSNSIDSRYLAYALQALHSKLHFDYTLKAHPSVIRGTYELDLPSAAEQRAIAQALSDADELIGTLERLIVKKQAIKQGMMQQLLTGRTRLPGFDGEWTDATLGSLARVTGGGTPSTRIASYWGGDIPWFTPAEIRAGGSGLVSHSKRTITFDGLMQSAASLLPAGTVLVTSRASIGNCAVSATPVTTNQGFTSMIPRDPSSIWFLYYWIQQNSIELESRAAGSTFLEISASKVSAIPLRQPNLDEQSEIGTAIRDTDLELDVLGHRLSKAQAIKTGMMQQLLTGRTRLPVEANT